MYNASANDLERVASDLDWISQKYQEGSEELDQYVITLEGATSHLLSGAVQQWRGISSEAFLSAWLERKARLQQASMLMSESVWYLQRLSRTIEDNLPAIRADQNMLSQTIFSTLGADAQASIMNEESQAQNTVFMAIAALNSQLEQLIEEVNDCPEADQEGPFPGFGDNISRNDSGASGETPEQSDDTGLPFPNAEIFHNGLPEKLEEEIALAKELGVEPTQVGTPEFDAMVQQANEDGDKLKWVITKDGELWFIPARVGDDEINHTIMTNGSDVIAAGEAEIMDSWLPESQYIALKIDNHTGHYLTSSASLEIAKIIFEQNGISVPDTSINSLYP